MQLMAAGKALQGMKGAGQGTDVSQPQVATGQLQQTPSLTGSLQMPKTDFNYEAFMNSMLNRR